MNQKYEQNMHHANVNVDLMEEKIIQIKIGITINVNASVRSIIFVKNIIFGILLHVVVKIVKMVNI